MRFILSVCFRVLFFEADYADAGVALLCEIAVERGLVKNYFSGF